MQIISSYGVELRKQNIPIRQTLEIYRSAVSYLIGIYVQVWEELAEIPDAKRRFNAAEHLVHTTKKNHACFDFDIRFPKMPSYLRRSAIQHALGTVSSYKTRLDLWEKTDGKSGKPRLVYENHAMPVFYRDVMYREGVEGKDEAYLKLYDGHDWKWCRRILNLNISKAMTTSTSRAISYRIKTLSAERYRWPRMRAARSPSTWPPTTW